MNRMEQDHSKVSGVEVGIDTRLDMTPGKYSQSDGITMVLARRGVAHIEVDFTVYELKENNALTFAPMSTVRYVDMDDDFSCCVLSFDHPMAVEAIPCPEPLFMDFLRRYPLGDIPAQRADAIAFRMSDVAHFLYKSTGPHHQIIVRNIIQNILFELYDATMEQFLTTGTKAMSRQDELFIQFIHLVYKYGDKEREVAFYSDKMSITPRYLARILRELSRETAKEIIDRHCVQEIKSRLRTTNDSVQSIAFDMKFPDQSFFTRYFKKQTGMTPTEFRAMDVL